jgi:chromosome segregation ATPase
MSLSRQTPSTQAITLTTAGTAFDPTELANGVERQTAHVQGLVAELQALVSELAGLQEKREQLQLNYAREEEAQAAREKAKQELAACHDRVTEVEKELAGVRVRKEEMEATYRDVLKQLGEQLGQANRKLGREQVRSEELGRDKDEAVETANRLRDQLRGLRAEQVLRTEERAAILVAREEAKQLVADCTRHWEQVRAKVEEEKARADKAEAEAREERRRAEEAVAMADEQRRRAEEAQAQAQAATEQRQASDAQAAHAKTALKVEAWGHEKDVEQIDVLQAQIAQLTQQLQQTQGELAQAQAETQRAEDLLEETANAARRLQAGDVLVHGNEYKGLIDYLVRPSTHSTHKGRERSTHG